MRSAVVGTLAGAGAATLGCRWLWSSAPTPAKVTAEDLKRRYQKHQPEPVPLPIERLMSKVRPGTQPVVIVACGSFSPPTNMHMRLMEDAKVAVDRSGKYTVIGGYMSPTHILYGKKSLVDNHHRVNMMQAATASSSWIMVDAFECCQPEWTTTALVLDLIRRRLENWKVEGSAAPVKVLMVCGADLLESFPVIKDNGEPLWTPEDQKTILADNGVACLEREGTDLQALIQKNDILRKSSANIEVVTAACQNDISSTAVRKSLRSGGSVRYLVPDPVIDYIEEHDLASKPQWQ